MPQKKPNVPAVKHSLANLFDSLLEKFQLKNDAALARALDFTAPEVSKHRRGKVPCSDRIILRIHEKFDMKVSDIRQQIVAVAE